MATPHAVIDVAAGTTANDDSNRGQAASGGVCGTLAVVLPASYVLTSVAPHFVLSHFGMVPVNTFLAHRYLWNLVTHLAVEPSMPLTAINVAVALHLGRPIEADWGTKAFCMYLAVVAAATSAALFVVAPLLSAMFNAPFASSAFCGFMPATIAIALAAWQRAPDSAVVSSGGALTLRASHLPLALLLATGLCDLVLGPGLPEEEDVLAGTNPLASLAVPSAIAFHAAWFYLRFLRNGAGDPSAAMAYDMLFPGPLRILARAAGRAVFPVVRCCGLGAAIAAAAAAASAHNAGRGAERERDDGVSIAVDLPGSNPTVADRRRQVALAALAERLQKAREQQNQHQQHGTPVAAASAEPAELAAAGFASPPGPAPVAGRRTPTDSTKEAVDF